MIKSILNKYKELISYSIIGVLTTLVSLGSYFLLIATICNPSLAYQLQIANIISWICSVTFAYITNKKFVFNSTSEISTEAVKFYGCRITTLLLDMALMFILVTILGINSKISKILVQVIVFISNYLISKFLVFKQ